VHTLELLSIGAVLELFTTIKSKEIENLRWINKIGTKKSQVERKYVFALPAQMKQEDRSKSLFEKRIN
jgi:hypothetical protein